MNKKNTRDLLIYSAVVILVILIWLSFTFWINRYVSVDNTSQDLIAARGQFGDKFGAVNSLFSGLAFAGIIITLLLQKRDLSETRSAMGIERFNNTFFQLLNLHIEITSRLKTIGFRGMEAFDAFDETLRRSDDHFYVFSALQKISRDKVRKIIDSRLINDQLYPELSTADIANLNVSLESGVSAFEGFLDSDKSTHEQKIINAYTKACLEHIDHFSHYFRNLYHLFKFIDESKLIGISDKEMYSKYVRSQLSDIELVCLFYNSISKIALPGRTEMELGFPKMQKYLIKYDILQNMNPRSLIHPIHQNIFKGNGVNQL